MDEILLHEFQQDELADGSHITDIFVKSLKSASNTPVFGHGSMFTQIQTTIILCNLKEMYGMSDTCFSTLLR